MFFTGFLFEGYNPPEGTIKKAMSWPKQKLLFSDKLPTKKAEGQSQLLQLSDAVWREGPSDAAEGKGPPRCEEDKAKDESGDATEGRAG